MKTALKELWFYKKKYLLIESLVVLMIFMVMFLSGLTNGLRRFVSAGIENMPVQQFILDDEADGIIPVSTLSTEDLDTIEHANLKDAEELVISRNQLTANASEENLDVTYVVLEKDSRLSPKIIEGNALGRDTFQVVLDNRFKADGIQKGDHVTDKKSGLQLTVVGFTSGAMYGHTGIGYISQETYVELAKKTNPRYSWSPQAIVTKGETPSNLKGLSVWNKEELIEKIPGYAAEQGTLQMITWVLVIASAVILAVFFYIVTLEKRQQFGVMKAIGMGMGQITYQELSQVFLLAFFGAIIGDALALAMASILPVKMPFFLQLSDVIILSLVFVGVTVLSSLLSVSRIAKVDPLMIINGGDAS